MLKRITICETYLPISYNGVIQFKVTNKLDFDGTRNAYRRDLVKSTNAPYNGYSAVFDLYDPNGFLAMLPIAKEDSIDARADELRKNIKGIELDTAIMTGILVGNICHRKFDNFYSIQYANLTKLKIDENIGAIEYNKL